MRKLFATPEKPWLVSAVIAAVLLIGALFVPLWRMELVAPQYPAGLVMEAYGYKFADDPDSYYDDVREINGLNHYIGMKPIKEVTEMQLFIPGVIALAAGTLLVSFVAWQRRWLRVLIIGAYWFVPLFFVADLQFWLYRFGHTMDPDAALDTGAFTPKVFGETQVWNFHSETRFEMGFYLMVAAALVITFVPLISGWYGRLRAGAPSARRAGILRRSVASPSNATILKLLVPAALLATAWTWPQARATAQEAGDGLSLQQRIDRAAPEDIIIVESGTHHGAITIDKPISLIGRGYPIIDGGGQGDVVTISADDVIVSGFEIRGSGKSISKEPAAIKIIDADRVKLNGNRLRDAYFGIHATGSRGSIVENNHIDAGAGTPVGRRGHGVYFWQVYDSVVHGNVIRHAADAIHLEFSDGNAIGSNRASDSRYALHFMYAHRNKMIGNTFTNNLAGAVLMFSHDLILKDNELSSNRRGATGAGILLKDDDNIFVEGNRILRNKYGMTVEGTPQSAGATAIFRRNTFALNDVGMALRSNAPITFVENAVIDNGVQVKALGGDIASNTVSGHGGTHSGGDAHGGQAAELPRGAVWSSSGHGNYWSDYRGYDADGDGVGDQPYVPRPAFAGRLGADETLRVFQFTPAQQAIDLAADMFPVFRYNAVIEDSYPLMEPPTGLALARSDSVNLPMLTLSALLTLTSVAAAFALAGADVGRALGALAGRPRGAAAQEHR
jgi:nitrous oxidase accessory protein